MFFICHTVANIFENNMYCYAKEEKDDNPNSYAMKQYLIKICICLVAYITALVFAMFVKPFAENKLAILVGNGIGFITGSIHFKLMAEENYQKQKAKYKWDSWNYMSFDEKKETIRKQRNISNENLFPVLSAEEPLSDSLQSTNNETRETCPNEKISYGKQITDVFERENGLVANSEILPNGNEILTINYAINYLWVLSIMIDRKKALIKIHTPFFQVKQSKKDEIYEILSEWNRKFLFIKYFFESTPVGQFVVASNDIPLIEGNSVGRYVFDIADEFIRAIDNQFGLLPKDIVGC